MCLFGRDDKGKERDGGREIGDSSAEDEMRETKRNGEERSVGRNW